MAILFIKIKILIVQTEIFTSAFLQYTIKKFPQVKVQKLRLKHILQPSQNTCSIYTKHGCVLLNPHSILLGTAT
jgi:hypothetical protein